MTFHHRYNTHDINNPEKSSFSLKVMCGNQYFSEFRLLGNDGHNMLHI